MHPSAFVAFGKAGQVMGRLEGERFDEFDMHDGGIISQVPHGSHPGRKVVNFYRLTILLPSVGPANRLYEWSGKPGLRFSVRRIPKHESISGHL